MLVPHQPCFGVLTAVTNVVRQNASVGEKPRTDVAQPRQLVAVPLYDTDAGSGRVLDTITGAPLPVTNDHCRHTR